MLRPRAPEGASVCLVVQTHIMAENRI